MTAKVDAAAYDFTIHSAGYDIVGEMTTAGTQVTSLTGQVTGLLNASITGLGNQPNIYYTSDNMFNPSAPFVSNEGILFSAGGYFLNVYSVLIGSEYQYYLSNSQFLGNYYGDPTSAPLFAPGDLILSGTITAVPELPTWIALLTGFAGLAVVGRRRWIRQDTGASAA